MAEVSNSDSISVQYLKAIKFSSLPLEEKICKLDKMMNDIKDNLKPIVKTVQGKLRGNICEDAKGRKYYSFEGIPFAKAPIGKLRFKAPVPVDPWPGIFDATSPGKSSAQKNSYTGEIEGSEDCLNLNVFTLQLPVNTSSMSAILKPVFVFIHGGGFLNGSNEKNMYGPELLVAEDIVLVTINYRVGYFGLLSFEDPNLGVPGNAAFKDMVLALKWVQQNIAEFSGDPNNVCIGGTSAGAAATHFLVLSPMAKGLFHKAICQSGSALNGWTYSLKNNASILSKYLNIESRNDQRVLEELLNASVEEICNAQETIHDDMVHGNFSRFLGAVVENPCPGAEHFLTKHPLKHLMFGDYNKVPILMGYNNGDGMIVEGICPPSKQPIYWEKPEWNVPGLLNLERHSELSRQLGREVIKFYFGSGNISRETHLKEFYKLTTDNSFLWGMQMSAQLHCDHVPVYFYRHSLETGLNFYKGVLGIDLPGVCHADELGYLFSNVFTEPPEPDSIEDLGQRRFVRMWTNFIKYSNPTPKHDPLLENVIWPQVTDKNNLSFLDINEKLTIHKNPEEERMNFWKKIYSLGRLGSKL